MPITIHNESSRTQIDTGSIADANFDYKYPRDLDLRPDSQLHKDIIEKILQNAQEAHDSISQRYDTWREIQKTLTVFVSPSVKREALAAGDQTVPVIIPSSYAILETILTFMVAAFIQEPVFRYDPVGPEDAIGAALLELIIQTQVEKAKMALNLHTQWRDGLAYGLGPVAPYWDVKHGKRRRVADKTDADTGIVSQEISAEETILYEGNALNNIDPFLYLPDPTVAAQDVQKGRYVGWAARDNKLALLTEEFEDDSGLFNVKYLKFITGQSRYMSGARDADDRAATNIPHTEYKASMDSPVDLLVQYVTLIPEDWDLGRGQKPKKWRFILAGDSVLISAQPLDLDHDMYPVAVAAPDYDGYSASPISRIEVSLGMQNIIDWLFNSHISNVRKAVNDMLVVDPSLINMNDLRKPGPGKIIRTRRANWGKGVQNAVEQLKITDITQRNMGDIQFLLSQLKEDTSAVDVISGIVREGGERRSATEFRDARTSALSKVSKTAIIIGLQSMQDLGFMFASQTQQLMSEPMKVKLTGRWEEDLKLEYGKQQNTLVDPRDIMVDTDVVVKSGTIPGSEPVDLWIQLLQTIGASPELSQEYDLGRIMMHIARQLGATNARDFIRSPDGQQAQLQPQVQPTVDVIDQAERGNLVPIEEV